MLQWTVALIAGGGSAGTIQAFTGIGRLASTVMTGGLGNALLSTIESSSSVILSGLAIAVPVFAVCLVAVLLVFTLSKLGRGLALRREPQAAALSSPENLNV
jgi:ABC-type proline/glycine betaine transport system permease subunit